MGKGGGISRSFSYNNYINEIEGFFSQNLQFNKFKPPKPAISCKRVIKLLQVRNVENVTTFSKF